MERRRLYHKLRDAGASSRDIRELESKETGISKEELWKAEAERILAEPASEANLTRIGHHMNEALDRNYKIDVFDYQYRGSKKFSGFYSKI